MLEITKGANAIPATTVPWQTERCDEEAASEQTICQVRIYRAVVCVFKGQHMNAPLWAWML